MSSMVRHRLDCAVVCFFVALVPGCLRSGTRQIVGVPGPRPFGSVVDAFNNIQETNAEASDFVIYQHEWIGATSQLGSAGQDHIKEIARRLSATPFPVLVEPSAPRPFDDREYLEQDFTAFSREKREIMELDRTRRFTLDAERRSELDEARRQEVALFLNALGYPFANERVFLSYPLASGLSPAQSLRNFNFAASPFGAGGSGGFGGGGGGSSR